jgi:quercetin dioxygenase-like cupin family protein
MAGTSPAKTVKNVRPERLFSTAVGMRYWTPPLSPPTDLRFAGLAEVQLPCADLAPTLAFFVDRLGFRVEVIFPAEEPTTASLSGHGLRVRLAPVGGDPGIIRLACEDLAAQDARVLIAPNGTRIELVEADPQIVQPLFQPEFVLTRAADGPEPGAGRAGMIYRDLIPSRLGGAVVASHISIREGGPVADWVHFHKVSFQMIFCRRGWVKLVYEDQGEPFILSAGDCVLQPPRIRHRVLESSPGLEVVEIGCPALHETLADHDMALPTGRLLPARDFGGQVFLRHIAAETSWMAYGDGFERRETGMGKATRGGADVGVLRPATASRLNVSAHHGDLLFGFVLEGAARLERQGDHLLTATDAFVIPPGQTWALADCSVDFALLQVALPGGQPGR